MEKNQPFVWGPEQKASVGALKEKLATAPVLGYPNPKGKFILDCDASNVGVGCVLSQMQDGIELLPMVVGSSNPLNAITVSPGESSLP